MKQIKNSHFFRRKKQFY